MKALVAIAVLLGGVPVARAFCGLYVGTSSEPRIADATQVVVMRNGTRTVLSMRSTYRGPSEPFVLVLPVPSTVSASDVQTLPRDVFDRVDAIGAPRVVEYVERDPCAPPGAPPAVDADAPPIERGPVVTGEVAVEAHFVTGEYQISILSAKSANEAGLAAWLREHGYQLPAGAEAVLAPYVAHGSRFVVAKVDPAKLVWVGKGSARHAELSPLRVHYDSDDLTLPIRIGRASAAGTQDLIVNILAPHQRYEAANLPDVRIPTNLDVRPGVSEDHEPALYAALFDRTATPGATPVVVTEYAWDIGACEPCPGPMLSPADLQTLGADVLGEAPSSTGATKPKTAPSTGLDFVHTRLHLRYGDELAADLVLRAAVPIAGGRELRDATGDLEVGARRAEVDAFQARYAIRHAWTGPLVCPRPIRGRWDPVPRAARAIDDAFARRDAVALEDAIAGDIPELGHGAPDGVARGTPVATGCSATSNSAGLLWPLGLGAWLLGRRRPHLRRTR